MTQFTLEQLRKFGIRPDTNLGQHFLVDDNILNVIGGLAELAQEDITYEPGVGVGVLTRFLADRVAHVHGVEIDRRLEPAVESLLEGRSNVTMHWGDATDVHPHELTPLPNKLVSNLPYHVAGPIVAEALQHALELELFCVMVQREVADRFFAPVGGSSYGALSVLIQALCERTGLHPVSRSVFAPPPNVDSTLLAFRRRRDVAVAAPEVPAFASFVRGSFTHRRKTLPNNLSAKVGGREPIVAALADLGKGPSARPQELAADEFVQLWKALG